MSGSWQGAAGIGGLLARSQRVSGAYESHYYHSDGNGNVTALLNANQVVSARYLYDPYGNLLASSGGMADANVYRFSSQEFHDKSGLYAYAMRFYEPRLGRWLNGDPLREGGGINLYRFCGGDPINRVDPWGFQDSALTPGDYELLKDPEVRKGFTQGMIAPFKYVIKVVTEERTAPDGSPLRTGIPFSQLGPFISVGGPGKGPMPNLSKPPSPSTPAVKAPNPKPINLNSQVGPPKPAKTPVKILKPAEPSVSFPLSVSASEKAVLLGAKPEIEAFVGIVEKNGSIRLFKSGENDIFGHADLVRQGLATPGDTLGFSTGLNAQGKVEVINMSELNVHLGLGGELTPEIYGALKQVLGN